MTRFWHRFTLAIGIAIGAAALAADVAPYNSIQDFNALDAFPRLDSGIYRVSKTDNSKWDKSSRTGYNAVEIKEGKTAVIYIPRGITLTVIGAPARRPDQIVDNNADYDHKRVGSAYNIWPGDWGGAGIYVPTNSTLIVTGEGTLIAKGGNGAEGMQGFMGWDQPWVGSSKAQTGGGGQGGWGGGGAGAAIGGRGGKGGKCGAMWDTDRVEYPDKNNFENFTGGNNNRDGNPGEDGEYGSSMGNVYILGTVKVEATGGLPGSKGGAAGSDTWWEKGACLYEGKDDWIAGPGGGGGGGGAGCGVAFAIGGGAGGGGGGGGGATGSFVVSDDWDDSDYKYGDFSTLVVGGDGGIGGKGPANISGSNGENGLRSWNAAKAVTKKSGDYGHDVNCKKGGAGGNAGEPGKNGQLFLGAGVIIESKNNIQAYPSATTISYTSDQTGFDCIRYPITLVQNSESSRTFKQTLGCLLPETMTVPSRPGYEFLGYFTGRNGTGEMYYNSEGVCQIEGAWSKCEGLTLYASWAMIGQGDAKTIVIEEGTELEIDGLVDTTDGILIQPSKGNLFDIKRGGKLVLKNLAVLGSALGRDSVICNYGEVFVTNCVFKENFSPYGAGAVYRDGPGAKAVFYGCTFKENSALEGGVIAAEDSTVSVIYSSFLDNYTQLEGECDGQTEGAIAIALDEAKLKLIGCTAVSNHCNTATGRNIALHNSSKKENVALINNIFVSDKTPVVSGVNNKGYVNTSNFVKTTIEGVLSDEIKRIVNGVEHRAHRPIGEARKNGYSHSLYRNQDFTEFATSKSADIDIFIDSDQFGQHPLEDWYGAITGNTLQYLINNTPVGGTLVVPEGRYDPVEINKKITIVGENRDTTYIDADSLEPCLVLLPGGESTSINDFSFIYGKGENGGAITVPEGTYAGYVTNCFFSSCRATNGGAVAYLKTASQCVFTNCLATATGGGTYGCELVERSRYLGCIATEAGGGASEDKTIRACLLSQNISAKGGGGNKTKFYNCTFDRNQATAAEDSQAAIFSSYLTGCVFFGNRLPTATSQDGTSYENLRASAEYKSDKFYNAPEDFHLRLKNVDRSSNTRTPVNHDEINVGKLDSNTLNAAYNNRWLDIDGSPLVSEHMLTGEKFLYGGCYAFAPFKISGTIVTGEEEWYDSTNAKTSLREAIDAALTDPAYMTNKVATITFSNDLKPKDREDYVILTLDESQIDVAAFTNRTLVIQGPTNKVIAINGNHKFRAFRVLSQNNLKVENLLFQNCLGSEYGSSPQASAHGGAILNYGNLSVSNCVFAANTTGERSDYNGVSRPIGYGGAIATMDNSTNIAKTVIQNSSFAYNRAQRGGALYADKNTTTDVFFSTFGENVAIGSGATEAAGGAIAADMGSTNALVSLVNCTLVANSVPEKKNAGGGIAARQGLTLLNSIVLGNTSGGITNDVEMVARKMNYDSSDKFGSNAKVISSVVGFRTEENSSGSIKYSDELEYIVSDLEEFLSTTNAVSAKTVLPHILYPTSSNMEKTALVAKYSNPELFGYLARNDFDFTVTTNKYTNVHEETVIEVTTNYTFQAEAIRGNSILLSLRGNPLVIDQTGEEFSSPIFGATKLSNNPSIYSKQVVDETEDSPTEEDPLKNKKVIIVDFMGVTNAFESASAALKAYKFGDMIKVIEVKSLEEEPIDTEYLALLTELNDAFYQLMVDCRRDKPWFDIYRSSDYTTYSITLNEKAMPVAGELEANFKTTEVAMRSVENMKPGLWYALGYSDSPAGPFAVNNWQEGKGPDAAGEMYFDKPLTAPKNGASGFYRVIVAPYCPSGEVIR